MFDHAGAKLKLVAYIYLIVGVIFSLIFGFILMTESFGGLLLIIFGSFSSWVSALIFYALGEIVDELKQSNVNTYGLYRLLKKTVPEEKNDTSTQRQVSPPLYG